MCTIFIGTIIYIPLKNTVMFIVFLTTLNCFTVSFKSFFHVTSSHMTRCNAKASVYYLVQVKS